MRPAPSVSSPELECKQLFGESGVGAYQPCTSLPYTSIGMLLPMLSLLSERRASHAVLDWTWSTALIRDNVPTLDGDG